MKTFWLAGLPLPPSVNDTLEPAVTKKFSKKTGKVYWGGYMRSSKEMEAYKTKIQLYKNKYEGQLKSMSAALMQFVKEGFVLQVDLFVAFESSRVFSVPNKKILRIDANNRSKPAFDAVATLLDIDDAVFFRGDCEKVTTAQKDSECTMVRIQPIFPRSLDEIRSLMKTELTSVASKNSRL